MAYEARELKDGRIAYYWIGDYGDNVREAREGLARRLFKNNRPSKAQALYMAKLYLYALMGRGDSLSLQRAAKVRQSIKRIKAMPHH